MNRIYKVIWSKVKHQYVVVSELAHRDGKRSSVASKSVRTLMAVLAVCGMATLDYGIQDSYAAEGAVTSAYQYVATGGASKDDATGNNGVWVDLPFGGGYWQKRPTEYYKDITVGDKKYRYVYTEANDGKAYWVREGYSINIVEQERFEGAKKNTVIQYHKEDPDADDSGLVQSFQNVDKNLGVTTAHGDTLWSTSTGVYAGAVNMPETKVTSGISTGEVGNEFVINNGATTVNKSTFNDYFREVNYNSNTGEYMYNGNPVNMSALRVVDGQIGVFLTTPNGSKVYEGDVFGVYNEILMTGTNENGDLVSYWGAEDIDPMAPIGSMPKYLFDEKFEKIDNNLVALHKDDIEEIQVAQAGSGGTIGLARFGGLDVDGTVTVTSVSETGKDVQIQFANDKGSFKVYAGSKVEGTTGEASGDTLTGLSINGVDYKLGGGQNYTAGTNVEITNNAISTNDYRLVGSGENGTGSYAPNDDGEITLQVKDNKTGDVKNVKLTDIASAEDVTDQFTIVNGKLDGAVMYDKDGDTYNKNLVKLAGNTYNEKTHEGGTTITNVADGKNASDAVNFSQLQVVKNAEDYVKSGTLNTQTGDITLTRELGGTVTISGLQNYVKGLDTYVTNAELNGSTLTITQNQGKDPFTIDLSGLTSGMSSTDYQVVANPAEGSNGVYSVDKDGNLKLTVKDLNDPNAEAKEVSISGIAQKADVDSQFTQINTDIDNMGTKLKHITHYDGVLGIGDYTEVEGTKLYHDGSINSVVESGIPVLGQTTNTFDFSKDGGKFVTESVKTDVSLKETVKTTTTNSSEFNEKGATFTKSEVERTYDWSHPLGYESGNTTSFTNINGKHITAGDVQVNGEDGKDTITGLSNVSITAADFADDTNRVATEKQLKAAMTEIGENAYAGWNVATNTGTENAKKASVGSDGTVDFSSADDGNIVISQDGTNLTFGLGTDLNVTKLTSQNLYVTNVDATKDTSVTNVKYVNEYVQTHDFYLKNGKAPLGTEVSGQTTGYKADDNGNIDMIVANENGTKKHVILTDVASKAALDEVTTDVNTGWTATDGMNSIAVNPDNATLAFRGDENVTVSADAANHAINVSLNDDITLGTVGDTKNYVQLSGTKGTLELNNAVRDGDTVTAHHVTMDENGTVFEKIDGYYEGGSYHEDHTSKTTIDGGMVTVKGDAGTSTTINGGAITTHTITGLDNIYWSDKIAADVEADRKGQGNGAASKAATQGQLLDAVTKVDAMASQNERHIATSADGEGYGNYIVDDNGSVTMTEVDGNGEATGNSVVISNVASKSVLDEVKTNVDAGWSAYVNGEEAKNVHPGNNWIQFNEGENVALTVGEDGTIWIDTKDDVSFNSVSTGNFVMDANGFGLKGQDSSVTYYITPNGLNGGGQTIQNVAEGVNLTDAVNVGQLNSAISDINQTIVDSDKHVAGGNYQIDDKNQVTMDIVDGTGKPTGEQVVIEDVASASDLGDVDKLAAAGLGKDETTGKSNAVDAILDVNKKVDDLDTRVDGIEKKHSTVSEGNGIKVEKTDPTDTAGADYKVSLANEFTLTEKDGKNSITINANDGTISATNSISAGQTKISDDGVSVGDKTYITSEGINANNQVVTNVADGAIAEGSKEAINGGQMFTELGKRDLAIYNNSQNIQMLSNSVNKLDNRIDRVGAGAAALAALHPLDFDPDAKWDFAAGYGNYRGANAVAVGAYYRPNEDVMFSVGGSMGGGENMVNAGVSLKIGAGSSNVTTSRVAMAKEIKSMRDIVAKQDAQIQKLTAMVNALVGVQTETDTTNIFPDVPENHWAYEAVAAMAKSGLVKGYPDGEFKGDRTMTRYEFAQIVYNAIQAGAEVDARLVEEFKPELEYFHIATVAKDKDGNPTIERVRAN